MDAATKSPDKSKLVSIGTPMTWNSFREFYLKNGKLSSYEKTVTIDIETASQTSNMLRMTEKELYNKYGLKRNESVIKTIPFPSNYEIEIKCVAPSNENETGWTEAVLFKNGCECAHTDAEDYFIDEWQLEDDDILFKVTIISEKE